MVTIMNLTIGLLTPPVGLVLFTAVNVGKRPFGAVVKAFWPFIIISYLALFVVPLFPRSSPGCPAHWASRSPFHKQ